MKRTLQHRLDRLEGRAAGQPTIDVELDLPLDVAARAGAAMAAGTFPEALASEDLMVIVAAHDRVTREP